jgi:hypothetical protein
MSAPVDVLAIFDDCIEKLNFHYRDTRSGDEMRSARAAVAELVAKAEKLAANDFTSTSGTAYVDIIELRAALARFGGAK